ncbi:DUF29 domain-containing protein [Thiocapsa bogorovii]|uniref:DUF29 domain-containing protein n=1 Tax=Thiocapsa bogorovii TaxID=521689 RepID=UPI001E48D4B7|nr:DUF29 domain-containing protein [Thiocapsa bogorovii]UHD17497.1 DUF29 domain-containing protein [Thiocapsa bogorovii]
MSYPAYDDDLVGWAAANAALLRAGRLAQVDALHLAEELEDLGKSERRSLTSHLGTLMLHLLKWQFQTGLRGPSWRISVNNARAAAAEILEDSSSLRPALQDLVDKAYPLARRNAIAETGLPEATFPQDRRYAIDQLLDDAFWPET